MKKTKKLLAILMTSVMILSVFCVSISASNIDGVLIEDVTLREENVKHFKNPDGSYTALVYSSPVHRKDSAGNWQDIDNRMDSGTVSDKQAYVTSDGRTVFSKKISSDDSSVYTLSENGYSIKMSISEDGLGNTSAKLSNHASKYIPKADDSLETQYKKVKEIDNTTTVTYKNALKGIDLEYQLSANDIKENIIVRKAQSAYSYTFVYELEGLEAELLDDGSVIFADEDTAEGIYRIPTPYMTDAEGARSEAVAYTLSETAEGVYSLTVTADASWINSEDRELPVTIDPTVTMNDENVYITYVNEYSPSSNYNGSGKISMAETTMFKIYNLPTLPNGAAIYAASFSVNYSSGSSGTASVGLYRVYGDWTDYDVTWNDLYSASGTLSLSSTAYASASWSLSSTSQTHSFDVKELVRHWYEGTEDYGVALKYLGDEDCVINVSGTSTTLSISYNILPLPIADGTYYVRNVDEDKYLQKDDDAGVGGINYELWAPDGSTGQRWSFKYIYNGCYLITSLDDNKTLERYTYTDGSTELLHMNYVENKDSQQWYVSTTTEGYFKISPKNSLSQYLTAEDAGTNDAATVGFNTAQTDNTDEWAIVSMMFPLSGYEVAYNPDWWNDDSRQPHSNCYAYALNNASNEDFRICYPNGASVGCCLQPGFASYYLTGEFVGSSHLGSSQISTNFADLVELVVADANVWGITFSPIGKYETPSENCYKVALVVDTGYLGNEELADYHWYRQNPDGTWSHKPGKSPVTNLDASGNIIYDPQYADRRAIVGNICIADYTMFVGFFELSPLNHSYSPFDIVVQ